MDKKLKDKIDTELKQKRLWRAKELYRSAIKWHAYDKELYFGYAKVLFQLGDYFESGKYFLLTDSDDIKYKEAIDLFLNRHHHDFFYHLPRRFRKVEPKNYPKNLNKVINDNEALKKRLLKEQKHYVKYEEEEYHPSKKEDFIISLIFTSIVAIFLVGILTIGRFLWSLL